MKINILGEKWTLEERPVSEDKYLENSDGYVDWTKKLIVVEREMQGSLGDMDQYVKKVKRHEIIHAYLFQCGLAESTAKDMPWAQNEEMVDWFAHLGPKIYQTWMEAGAL